MTGPAPVRSYLGRIATPSPAAAAELDALRQRAWTEQGVVVLHPDEITDDWLRQAVKNEATRKFGKRMKR